MKIAYLILAHEKPAHLSHLLRALTEEGCDAYVHLDAKSDTDQFSIPAGANAVFTDQRIPVYWGEFSQVEATLLLMEQAIKNTDTDYDYFVLMSGSDYPIQSQNYIKDFFRSAKGRLFMNAVQMPTPSKPMSRLTAFVPSPDMPVRRTFYKMSGRYFRRFVRRDYKKQLGDLVPYAGSTWWALPKDAVQYVLQRHQTQGPVSRYFKNTICPDEMFFQTILCNHYVSAQVKNSVTYTDWSAGGNNPAIISQEHIDMFLTAPSLATDHETGDKGEALFARKFPEDSAGYVDQLRARLR